MQNKDELIKTSNYFTELDKYNFIATSIKQKTCNINFTLSNLINLSTKQDFLSNSIAEIEFVPENYVTTENSQYNEDLIIALQKLRVAPSWRNPFGKPYQSTDPAILSDVLIAILNCPVANNNTDLTNNFANNKIYNKEVLSNALAKLSLNPQSTATANNIIKIIITNNDISINEKHSLITSYLNPNLTKEFYEDIILYVKTQNWPSNDILNLCKLLTIEISIIENASNLNPLNNNSNQNKQEILQNIIDLKLSTTIQQASWKNAINKLINNSRKDISYLFNIQEPELTLIRQLYENLLQNELNYAKQVASLTTSDFFEFSKLAVPSKPKKDYEKQKIWFTFNLLITQIHQQFQLYDFEKLKSIKPLYLSEHQKSLAKETNKNVYMLITDFLKQPDSIDKLSDIEQNLDTWFLLNYDSNNTLKQQITDYKKDILQEINNLRTKHQNISGAPASPQQDCSSIASEIFKLLLNKNPNKSQFLLKLNNFLRPCFATGEQNCSFDETKLNAIIAETNYSATIEKTNIIQVINKLNLLLETEKNKLANTKKSAEEIAEQTYFKLPTPITESSIEAILQNKLDIPTKYNNLEIDPEFFLEIHNEYLKNKLTLLKQQMQLKAQENLANNSPTQTLIERISSATEINNLLLITNDLHGEQQIEISETIKNKLVEFLIASQAGAPFSALTQNIRQSILDHNLLTEATKTEFLNQAKTITPHKTGRGRR